MSSRNPSNGLSAAIASVIAPYAEERLNAALYSYNAGVMAARLQATFSRCRAEPRGQVLVAFFAHMTESDNDTNAARARAWPFTSRASMIQVLSNAFGWGDTDAYTLVFWPGNKFHPPPEVEVSEFVQYLTGDMLREQLSKYMGVFDAAVSFALPIWPSTSDGMFDESSAEVVIHKVLQYVGEVPPKTDDEQEEGGGSNKRAKRA